MNCLKFFATALIVFFLCVQGAAGGMRGCCSYHGGVCGDKCCDGSALSQKCAEGLSGDDFWDTFKPSSLKRKIVKSKWFSKYPKILINIFWSRDGDKQAPAAPSTESLVLKYHDCKIRYVLDGDTVEVTCEGQDKRVRLWGVDSPEKAQRFGQMATHFTAGLVAEKNIDLEVKGTDRYNRILAVVRVGDVNVNESLVRDGYAWVYRTYCTEQICEDWLGLEKKARAQRAGLWEDLYPVAPWKWRHYGKMERENSAN